MSVAIRAITRLQDADDLNVTLAVGVDEYALTYDHDTAKFVLRAPFDGTPYALLAGRAGGQTLYGGTAANDDITIHGTSDATRTTSYVLLQPSGGNVGIGTASPGVPLDVSALAAVGNYIRAISRGTSGYGASVILNSTSITSGRSYSFSSTGDADTGGAGLFSITDNSAAGASRLAINSSGLVGIGTTAPATPLHVLSTTATTNALRNVLTLGANVTDTGVGAAGLGAAVLFTMETTTTTDTSAASVQAIIYEATHATRKFDLVLNAYDTAIREGLRIRGDGSAAAIGFYGVAPIARAILATGAGATADNIITALQNLGLVKQS